MLLRYVNGNQNRAMGRLCNEMTNLFRDWVDDGVLANAAAGIVGTRAMPALNIWEDAQNFHAEAEVPGYSMENIEVLVAGNELTIKGKREEVQREGAELHRRERTFGEFSRVVQLPVDIDSEKVQATLANGVLTVTLPKIAAALPRKIEVKANP